MRVPVTAEPRTTMPCRVLPAITLASLAATREGLLIGISAGAALHGAIELASRPEMNGKRIVIVFADAGERYMSLPWFGG